MAIFPSRSMVPNDPGNVVQSPGSNLVPGKSPRRRMLDQILMAGRDQAAQNVNLARLGGSQYLDMLDQRRSDPFSTFY